MVQLGKFNTLKIKRLIDYGAVLDCENNNEILLPQRYVTPDMVPGSEVNVFIYNDSEDRPVAVTDKPKAQVGEFALLKVTQVNRVGAFLDWGLPKDLLVPFREQRVRMEAGRWYIVYVYVDDNSQRILASNKLDKFLDNVQPRYKKGDVVDIIITHRTDLGYKVIIDNLFWGMIYHNEIFSNVNIGEHHKAAVKQVRTDGKIDLILGGNNKNRVDSLSDTILAYLNKNGGTMPFGDKTSPEIIKEVFACSKKDFKKSLGYLLKNEKIKIGDEKTSLL